MSITILSIETSCDETATAVIRHDNAGLSVLASVVSSQIELHAKYGGVVPNLAAREHVRNIVPVVEETLTKAGVTRDDIDAIAVTQGPGLIPALLIGVSAGKTLAYAWGKPLLGIHHLEGHIYANFISTSSSPAAPAFATRKRCGRARGEVSSLRDGGVGDSQFMIHDSVFPLLALVVSGGHTQLVLMRDHFRYEIIGETRDDAAGEAFDKAARLLGLPYPGGPQIALRAANHESRIMNHESGRQDSKILASPAGGENRKSLIILPRPMIDSPDLDFSFSGLKTAVLYLVKENEAQKGDDAFIDEVAHEFQEAVVDVLVAKTEKAIERHSPKTVIIAGGVSANERLRTRLRNTVEERFPDTIFMVPEFRYSLDNAAMIGAAAAVRYEHLSDTEREVLKANALSLEPDANLSLL